MNQGWMFGSKLREELSQLLSEYQARVRLNSGSAGSVQSQKEETARRAYAQATRQALTKRQRAEQVARKHYEDLQPRLQEQLTRQRQNITRGVLEARKTLSVEAQKIHGAFAQVGSDFEISLQPLPPSSMVIGNEAKASPGSSAAPLLVPLVGQRGLLLRGHDVAAREFAEAVFARLIATVPVSSLRVTVFDPELHGILSTFSDLREIMGDSFPLPYFNDDQLRERFEEVLRVIQANTERMSALGARNLLDIWESAMPKPSLHVLLIDDRPGAMGDQSRGLLGRIIESGPARGVLVVLLQAGDRGVVDSNSWNEKTPDQRDDELLSQRSLTQLRFDGKSKTVRLPVGTEQCAATPIQSLSFQQVQRLLSAVADADSSQEGPIVGPERLLPQGGRQSSAKGIEIVLGDKENGSGLMMRLRSENPPLPNALIGGDVGTGKSNLLHTMNYAIAAKYSAEEVEVVLLDFKSGTEFQRYAPGIGMSGEERHDWLPNASIIGLESDRAFGLKVLEYAANELKRRPERFKQVGTNSYDNFREAGHKMPRLVVLIDEFQTFFEEDDEVSSEAVKLLSVLMRTGRAFGIHVVLSTQTLSGIRALSSQGDAIFAQVPVRIALRLGRAESQVMLANGNLAASRLRHRGEVVLNESKGEGEENNQYGVVTYAEQRFTELLQRKLWQLEKPRKLPRLFRGTVFAPRPTGAIASRTLMLGEAVNVEGSPVVHSFGADPLRTFAIVGSDERVTRELMCSSITSAYRSGSYGRVVVIGDAQTLELAGKLARDTGISSDLIDHEEAAAWLVQHENELSHAGTFVAVSDLQRIIGLMDERSPAAGSSEGTDGTGDAELSESADEVVSDFDSLWGESSGGAFGGASRAASDVLAQLAQSSANRSDLVVGTQLFVWIERVFGYDRQGGNGIAAYALAQIPTDELRSFFGHSAEQPEKTPRFFYARAGTGEGGVLAIPFGEEE